VVEDDVEKWVAGKAVEGWIPPPPVRKKAKKKVVMVAPSVQDAPAEPEAAAETEAKSVPETAVPEPVAPETAVPAPGTAPAPERKKIVKAPPLPPEPEREAPPAAVAAKPEAKPEPGRAPEIAAEAEEEAGTGRAAPRRPEAPVVVKRVNKPVKGTAAVGQASPEMIARLKRQAARGEGEERRGKKQPPLARPAAARASAKVEPVPAEADLSVKPIVKRPKTKGRPVVDEDREAAEKKVRAAKKSRGRGDEDWGIDDDDGGDIEVTEAAPARDDEAAEQIDTALLATDSDDDRGGAGFKHKRADFKSKRIQHELPASFAEIDNEFTRSIAGGGRRRGGRKTQRRVVGRRGRTRRFTQVVPRAADQEAVVRLGMTVRDLSIALGVKLQEIVAFMLGRGEMIQVNDILSEDAVTLIAERFKIPLKWESDEDLEEELAQEAQQQAEVPEDFDLVERPPVVTFMGHVDHGKTSLLDAIRNTRVVAGEHGGITQHIGAYSVVRNGKKVTFLDTPGHEAFSAMRARGANLTDIAVLVVAADDGVMPQTEEAAAHAKNAGVPIVVAINKCDLPSANPDRVRQELANRLGLLPEEWGGQVGMVEVSAHTKKGMDELVERILLEAEVLELRANPERPATGFVVEAKMSEGQGVVATLLVADGTMHNGDVILSSNGYGKIRFMFDEFGRPIESAGPGTPVRMSGLSAVPEAGDKFFILSDLLKARAIAEQRERESRQAAMAKRQHVTLENLTSHLAGSGKRELSVIVKADVAGSLEVLEKTLRDMATDEVGIAIIHSAVGGINHADVILADASDAIILGFHVGVESQARSAASSMGVQIRAYHIIYRMIEDMRAALEGLLPPEEKEVVQGHVEIRQVFRSSKIGAIAGCYVTDGQIQRTNRIRLYRSNVVIYEGTMASLKRVKDDVREVKAGFECGIKIANYDAIEEGDVIEAYSIEEIARKL
ncbi:MAG: translation initiation factor IF-2, partial [Planctomycetota bacterium]|nr:translation initiation factor IF-2 [Planctomycetota bacterium]